MEIWTDEEIAALATPTKRRVSLFELRLDEGTWRGAQTHRPVTDLDGRRWEAYHQNGQVENLGTSMSRRPREVRVTLHGIKSGQSIYTKLKASSPIGKLALIYRAWVDANERLIVQPKLRFAGVVAAAPAIHLGETDRVSLTLLRGGADAGRLEPGWDATPASHRAYTGIPDAVYDRVTSQTQRPTAIS